MSLLALFLTLISMASARPCVMVPAATVTAKDLAGVVPELADAPPQEVLFHAPAIGLVRHLTGSDLQRLARRSVRVAAPICVERESMRLEPDQVRSAILRSIPGSPTVLEIIEISRYPVPLGQIEFLLSGLIQPPTAKVEDVLLWNGRVVPATGGTVRVWVRLRVAIEAEVPRTREALSRRHVLTASDIEIRKEAGRVKDVAEAVSVDDLVGCVVTRQLGSGELLTRSSVRCLPKGTRVEDTEARVRTGNVVLKVKGSLAKSPGEGAKFRFQGRGMKKAVPARRNEKGIVEVSVP
jgi:hypothetical protein